MAQDTDKTPTPAPVQVHEVDLALLNQEQEVEIARLTQEAYVLRGQLRTARAEAATARAALDQLADQLVKERKKPATRRRRGAGDTASPAAPAAVTEL